MIRPFFILALALVLLPGILRAENKDPAGQFIDARLLIRTADAAARESEWRQSYRGYQAALAMLQQISNAHPGWQPNLVSFRVEYCTEKINEIKPRLPADPPPPPPSAVGSAPADNVAAEPVVDDPGDLQVVDATPPEQPPAPQQPVAPAAPPEASPAPAETPPAVAAPPVPPPPAPPAVDQPAVEQPVADRPIAAAADGSRVLVTLEDCLARALQYNLAVRVQQLEPEIERWGLTREQGIYDPVFETDLSYQDKSEPLDPERASSLFTSAPSGVIDERGWRFRSGITGRLQPGTRYELIGTDTTFEGTLAPENVHVGGLTLALTQPLLRNFGGRITEAGIRIARKNVVIAEHQFRQKVNDTIGQVVIAYHQLVYRIEDLKAKEDDLGRARQLLEDNEKLAARGKISSLEVTQARAGVAEREEAVITAANSVRETENTLKRLISAELSEWGDTVLQPVTSTLIEGRALEEAEIVRTALATNPTYLAAMEEVDRQGIQVEFRRNQLYPEVDLRASVGVNARAGTRTEAADLGDYLSELPNDDYPVWSVGVLVRIPLGNRQARGEYERAQLRADQALLTLKAIEQDIILQVKNVVGRVRANEKRIEAALVATELAEASLDAEKNKYQRGTSTSFLVLQAQSQVAAAKSLEIGARADLLTSLVELARLEGTLPARYGIEIEE